MGELSMYNSNYWKSQLNYYSTNKPPAPESYYNKSFVDKMNETRASIDNLVAEKDKAWSATAQSRDDYNAFYGNMSSYGDIYNKAESEFGVTEHQDNYEKSKKALAMAESTLAALPSSINAASNRVLTQEQRENRYNVLADRQMARRDSLMAQSSAYEEVWKNARKNQQAYATAEVSTQWKKLDGFNNTYIDSINNYNNIGKKLLDAKIELMDWESDYRTWQHQQYQLASDAWFKNLDNALERYKAALNVEMADRRAQYELNSAKRKDELAQSLVNLHWKQQTAKQNAAVINAGGLLGRLASMANR